MSVDGAVRPAAASTTGGSGVPVGLRQIDPELFYAIPVAERRLAERLPLAFRHRLPGGVWEPEASGGDGDRRAHAVLILHGIIVHDTILGGRTTAHLFGPGDMLHPWRPLETSLPTSSQWRCDSDQGAEVAVLGDTFARAMRRWPDLSVVIQERYNDLVDCLSVRTAIVSLPRAEQRILGLLWQFADRWGTVTPAGVALELPLTHELIGRLIGARRPTVTLALQMLSDQGLLLRTDAGTWRLAHGSHAEIDGASASTNVSAIRSPVGSSSQD